LTGKLDLSLAERLFGSVLLSGLVSRSLGPEVDTILDVGCGPGLFFRKLRKRLRPHYAVGVDLFLPFLALSANRRTYDDLVLCDARALPFKKKSFEAVLCTEVVEHLEKQDSIKLILQLEIMAYRKVVITTPVGYLRELPEYDKVRTSKKYAACGLDIENPRYGKEHRCGWRPCEFRRRAYRVVGANGHRFQRLRRAGKFSRLVLGITLPFAYLVPEIAFQMLASKDVQTPQRGGDHHEGR